MAYTVPGTVASGDVATAAAWNVITNDIIDHESRIVTSESAWTTYTPTWTAASGTPSIGNGTLTGKYMKVGKTVFFTMYFLYGSTSSATGLVWQFTLPVAAQGGSTNIEKVNSFSAIIYDANTGNPYTCTAWQPIDAAKFRVTQNSNNASIGSGVPAAWAASWYMVVNGTYQAA